MSKYNDFMSHIRVDDEMHRRIMNAVSEAIEQQGDKTDEGAIVQPLRSNVSEESKVNPPIKRKAKVSLITGLSIAAAAILVVGGAVMFTKTYMGRAKSASAVQELHATQACETVVMDKEAEGVDGAISDNKTFTANTKKNVNGAYGLRPSGDATAESKINSVLGVDGTNKTVKAAEEGNEDSKSDLAPSDAGVAARGNEKADLKDSLPFKVKTVGNGTWNGNSITTTVYTGENGEKMILLSAKAGTDILKAYYPEFKGIPALLQTEAGQEFKGIDTSSGRNEQVKLSGPFDAVTWTKGDTTYMLSFNTKTDVQVFISLMEKI